MADRSEMLTELRKRDCRVIFKKANGEERDMVCTLREDAMPSNFSSEEAKSYSEETIRVIDVATGEWRSFRIDRVISFS
jgi:hypothetical protein